MKLIFLVLFLFPILSMLYSSWAGEVARNSKRPHGLFEAVQDRVVGEYLISVKKGTQPAMLEELFQEKFIFIRKIGKEIFLIKLKKDPGVSQMLQLKEKVEWIRVVQPNYLYNALPDSSRQSKTGRYSR